jgi:cytochrome P450
VVAHENAVPTFELDFWSDEVILHPYPHYEALGELGPAVWLSKNQVWALTHYASVREALLNPAVFSSAKGCMVNQPMNDATQGIMLCSDDPDHLAMRRLFAKPLMPKSLADLRPRLNGFATAKVDELIARETFDAVADLAHFLPLTVVTELVGLDAEGREKMLGWASGIFDAFGPIESPRTVSGLTIAQDVISYVLERVERKNLVPGGWGEALFVAADNGVISEQNARLMLVDYLTPSLDTTINATSAAIELFANHPAEWNKLRADPSLIPHAINEVIRFESPIRAFARYVAQDFEVGGETLTQGSRALMLYACANRDLAKYVDPATFNIERRASDHLGFGMGTHLCAGMHLAKLELEMLLEALIPRVGKFKILEEIRKPHNTLRGLSKLTVGIER